MNQKPSSLMVSTQKHLNYTPEGGNKVSKTLILHSSIIVIKGVGKAITYDGILYYEEDGVEDLVTFAAAKKLNALIEVCLDDLLQ